MRRVLSLLTLGLLLPVSAAAQPVILAEYRPGRVAAASSLSMTLSTEDKAVLDAMAASLSVLDDWDESDRAKVNLIVGQAGIAAGNGSVSVTVPRVTIADDSTGRLRIWDGTDVALVDGSGNLQVICSNCSGSGVSDVEGSTFALGTDATVPVSFYFDDVSPTAATEDRLGLARISSNRNQYMQIRDGAAGAERGVSVTAQNELLVELGAGSAAIGSVDTELATAVLGADNLTNPTTAPVHALNYVWDNVGGNWDRSQASLVTELTHDTTFTLASLVGTALMAQFDDATPDSVDENDPGMLRMSGNRNLFVTLRDAAGNERGLNIDASGQIAVTVASIAAGDNDIGNVDLEIAGTAIAVNNGAANAQTLRIITASNSPDITALEIIDDLRLAQASTTSGQAGVLMQAAVTTSAPTYTTGQTNPLSLQTDGSLRAAVTNSVTIGTLPNAGATGSGVPGQANYIGGRAGANLEPVTACDSGAQLKMTTATTTEIVALAASQKVRVCYANLVANGTTTAKFVRGTGTNCGTGTADITPAYDLTAQTGWSGGAGLGTILDTASGEALCVVNGSAVNLSIYVRYTKF